MAADIPGLVEMVVRTLADEPDQIKITTEDRGRQKVVQLSVAPDDMGRIIGREGRVANAIRALLRAAPADERWRLEIVE